MYAEKDENGNIINVNAKGEPNYTNIAKYAVNGAIHYARAILDSAPSYDAVIAIGVNGYNKVDGSRTYEVGVYWLSKHNLFLPKKIGEYTDLSFLLQEHRASLFNAISKLQLSESEIESEKLKLEDLIERNLKEINQQLQDEHDIVEPVVVFKDNGFTTDSNKTNINIKL